MRKSKPYSDRWANMACEGTRRMATIELIIHLEGVDGEAVWWAESPDVPGFSAAAPSLIELRERAQAALEELKGCPVRIVECLEGASHERHDDERWAARVAQTDPAPC